MAIPKSAVLEKEINKVPENLSNIMLPTQEEIIEDEGILKIKQYPCLNEFVAVLQSVNKCSIELDDSAKYKNEGTVIGVGSGILTNGGRLDPQVKVGDYVLFRDRDIVLSIDSDGFYKGKKVVLLNERTLIMKTDEVPYEIVN